MQDPRSTCTTTPPWYLGCGWHCASYPASLFSVSSPVPASVHVDFYCNLAVGRGTSIRLQGRLRQSGAKRMPYLRFVPSTYQTTGTPCSLFASEARTLSEKALSPALHGWLPFRSRGVVELCRLCIGWIPFKLLLFPLFCMFQFWKSRIG